MYPIMIYSDPWQVIVISRLSLHITNCERKLSLNILFKQPLERHIACLFCCTSIESTMSVFIYSGIEHTIYYSNSFSFCFSLPHTPMNARTHTQTRRCLLKDCNIIVLLERSHMCSTLPVMRIQGVSSLPFPSLVRQGVTKADDLQLIAGLVWVAKWDAIAL